MKVAVRFWSELPNGRQMSGFGKRRQRFRRPVWVANGTSACGMSACDRVLRVSVRVSLPHVGMGRQGNRRLAQILLGHTKIESTVRYLGVDFEDALTLAEGTEICAFGPSASVSRGFESCPAAERPDSP